MNIGILCYFTVILAILLFCAGCGETVRGASKDAHRIGKGVRTVFVADE